jgi:cyclopropane-fatty-acyl-phospholipid synthase
MGETLIGQTSNPAAKQGDGSHFSDVRRLNAPNAFKIVALVAMQARVGHLTMILPDGVKLHFGGREPGPEAQIFIRDYAMAKRVLAAGDIGFAESYMAEEWDTPNLTAVLAFFSLNWDAARRIAVGGKLVRWINSFRHALKHNSKEQAKRNILAHYDLGNAFYEHWLDPTMTYSSALYSSETETLQSAQLTKYRLIAETIGAHEGAHLLEIGSGWGGFAEVAAREYGAKVTSITISNAQHDYAARRMFEQGLNDRVEIVLKDYRDLEGQYDGVASIEMFEAVGEQYWPAYFGKVHDSLKDGACAALQIITIDDAIFPSYRKRMDFIQRFIFPGGMLPSVSRLHEETRAAGMQMETVKMFAPSYARTLREWSVKVDQAWPKIAALGFDERFRRLWQFYLSYCEAGFATKRIDVGQFALRKA